MNSLMPFRTELVPMARLNDRMNRLFEGFFGGDGWHTPSDAFAPAFDLVDTPESLVFTVELPGVDMKDVNVSVQEHVLTIVGEKKCDRDDKGKTWFRRETSYGKFSRSITLPVAVDSDRIDATYDAGILTVTLPKSPLAKARQIPVKVKK